MDRKKILDVAAQAVTNREATHGAPSKGFAAAARLWNAYLTTVTGGTVCLAPGNVAVMMALLKIARTTGSVTEADHYVDIAGYAALAAELATD